LKAGNPLATMKTAIASNIIKELAAQISMIYLAARSVKYRDNYISPQTLVAEHPRVFCHYLCSVSVIYFTVM
jgi:hypothetical protein